MLAYAANSRVVVDRRSHPNAMLFIIGVHVAVAAVVMSAKMEIPILPKDPPTDVFWVPKPKDPPPMAPIQQQTHPTDSWIDHTRPQVPTPPITNHEIDTSGTNPPNFGTLPGTATAVIPEVRPILPPVKSGPLLLTSPSDLKPPYPASKLLNEEEASLTLKLTIDSNGRVVGVDPVGRTDRVFLEAARRHLIAHWRYKPATEDGRAVTSSAVITLRFELDG